MHPRACVKSCFAWLECLGFAASCRASFLCGKWPHVATLPPLPTAHSVTRLEGSVKSNLRTCVLEHVSRRRGAVPPCASLKACCSAFRPLAASSCSISCQHCRILAVRSLLHHRLTLANPRCRPWVHTGRRHPGGARPLAAGGHPAARVHYRLVGAQWVGGRGLVGAGQAGAASRDAVLMSCRFCSATITPAHAPTFPWLVYLPYQPVSNEGMRHPSPLRAVSDWVKNNVPCPFIIIRRSAVVNARLKFSSRQTTGAAVGPSVTAPGGIAPIDSLRWGFGGGRGVGARLIVAAPATGARREAPRS